MLQEPTTAVTASSLASKMCYYVLYVVKPFGGHILLISWCYGIYSYGERSRPAIIN